MHIDVLYISRNTHIQCRNKPEIEVRLPIIKSPKKFQSINNSNVNSNRKRYHAHSLDITKRNEYNLNEEVNCITEPSKIYKESLTPMIALKVSVNLDNHPKSVKKTPSNLHQYISREQTILNNFVRNLRPYKNSDPYKDSSKLTKLGTEGNNRKNHSLQALGAIYQPKIQKLISLKASQRIKAVRVINELVKQTLGEFGMQVDKKNIKSLNLSGAKKPIMENNVNARLKLAKRLNLNIKTCSIANT